MEGTLSGALPQRRKIDLIFQLDYPRCSNTVRRATEVCFNYLYTCACLRRIWLSATAKRLKQSTTLFCPDLPGFQWCWKPFFSRWCDEVRCTSCHFSRKRCVRIMCRCCVIFFGEGPATRCAAALLQSSSHAARGVARNMQDYVTIAYKLHQEKLRVEKGLKKDNSPTRRSSESLIAADIYHQSLVNVLRGAYETVLHSSVKAKRVGWSVAETSYHQRKRNT